MRTPARGLPDLRADCAQCEALCCMAYAFDAGDDFALDKPALHPCPNLSGTRCSIHSRLSAEGFGGCLHYDCLGAGQRLTQIVFRNRSWRTDAQLRRPMAEALVALRIVHANIELLVTARALPLPDEQRADLEDYINALTPDGDLTEDMVHDLASPSRHRAISDFLKSLRKYWHPPEE